MKKWLVPILVVSAAISMAPGGFAAANNGQTADSPNDIPLTTGSEAARRAFLGGLENLENQQTARAHLDFRSAVRADANFALAHLFLAYDTTNPTEESAELAKARALGANASKPEQLLIEWLAGSREGQYVPAISAMNDLIEKYPQDKFLLYLAGRWMVQRRNFDSAQRLLERAIAVDPDYPAALNELAYAYAYTGSFYLAFEALDKYVAALPGEPNTEDSYGEISRMAGEYDRSLPHYRKALEYDQKFIWSQVGLADTYMMMGKEQQARDEYAKAIATASSAGDRLAWETSAAMTFAYANDDKSFKRALLDVANEAHSMHFGVNEVIAYRYLTMYAHDADEMTQYSHKALEVLSQTSEFSATDADHQRALLLRTIAIHSAGFGDFAGAHKALDELQELAMNSKSEFVQLCSEGATGGVLWAEKKYAEAIPHLEEDERNPLTAVRLIQAYRETGDNEQADKLLQMVNSFHEPIIEDLMARRMLSGQSPRK